MTLKSLPIDVDALRAAATGAADSHFKSLGQLDVRVLGAQERSGDQLSDGVALSVDTGGVSPGQFGLVAGVDAVAAATSMYLAPASGDDDVLERWEPVMADLVVALTDRTGDLEPQGVQVLASGAGNGPALDSAAISVGLFRGDRLMVAVGFVAAADAVSALSAPVVPVFQELVEGDDNAAVEVRRMRLLRDVEMGVSVELGRTRMTVRDLLALAPGAIVELDKAAGAPVDVLVNGTLMARGEVVVIDEEFAVRISEIVTPEQDGRLGA